MSDETVIYNFKTEHAIIIHTFKLFTIEYQEIQGLMPA